MIGGIISSRKSTVPARGQRPHHPRRKAGGAAGQWFRRLQPSNKVVALLAVLAGVSLAFLLLVVLGPLSGLLPKALAASDLPERSDLIVILGGNYDTRVPFAVKLYQDGWAPKFLVFREPSDSKNDSAGRRNFTDVTIQMLREAGVPADRIVSFTFRGGVRSTADEARALRLYTGIYPTRRILIVTSSFHCLRARMTLKRALGSCGVDIRVLGVESPAWTTQNWQVTAYGRSQVRLECLKLLYYFFCFWG